MNMGRISMPSIPVSTSRLPSVHSVQSAAERIASLLVKKDALLITGAGISVDSGIRAYRGAEGAYTVHKHYRPIFHHEFVASAAARQRYWARSYLGYPPVRVAEPNPSHYATSALAYIGVAPNIVTQNVDHLHFKAHREAHLSPDNILELHGSLKHVKCLNCKTIMDRDDIQDELSVLNPDWAAYARDTAEKGIEPKSNPDGDVDLQDRSYDSFVLPDCPACGEGPLKPNVVFFGENIDEQTKKHSHDLVDQASSVIVIGSSLATYSAYRLLKSAVDQGKPASIISIGPSRGDPLIPADLRFDLTSTEVLGATLDLLRPSKPDPIYNILSTSGRVTPCQPASKVPAAS